MDFAQVSANLYAGSCPETLKDIRVLKAMGITTVLNLQTATDERHLKIDWKVLEECYDSSGINVRRVPVRDFDADDLGKKLPACVQELCDLLSVGHTVYLHCTAGCGRSPTVAIAYLHWNRAMVLADARDYVRSRRECSPTIEAILDATRLRQR